jgi:hypothetical protein
VRFSTQGSPKTPPFFWGGKSMSKTFYKKFNVKNFSPAMFYVFPSVFIAFLAVSLYEEQKTPLDTIEILPKTKPAIPK